MPTIIQAGTKRHERHEMRKLTPRKAVLTLEPDSGKVLPLPPASIRLDSVKRVRLELSNLYRDARIGKVLPSDAAKLAFILDRIRQCLVDYELVARIEALETTHVSRN